MAERPNVTQAGFLPLADSGLRTRPLRPTFYGRIGKRLFDCCAAVSGLLLLSPVLLLCALAIRLTSRGPVFFRQLRVGRNGKSFSIFKFRTMVHDAQGNGSHITSSADRRVTSAGRFLRYWKLDELPQLINIARGEMSLVGPRPQVLEKMRGLTEEERGIFQLSPGITGISALCDRREEERLSEVEDKERHYFEKLLPRKVQQELYYARNLSLKLDVKLILLTLLLLYFPGTAERWTVRILGRQLNLFSPAIKLSADMAIYAAALSAAYWLRYEGSSPELFLREAQLGILLVTLPLLRVLVNYALGVYRLLWRYISLSDAFHVVGALVPVSAVLVVLRLTLNRPNPAALLFVVPLSIIAGEFLLSSFGCLGIRAVRSALYGLEIASRVPARPTPKRLLLVCAGSHGASLAHRVLMHPEFEVVGFVDDDPMKYRTRISGVQVIGSIDDIPGVAARLGVDEVVLCPDGDRPALAERVQAICLPLMLPVRPLPDVAAFLTAELSAWSASAAGA